jgi:hypothetical protein
MSRNYYTLVKDPNCLSDVIVCLQRFPEITIDYCVAIKMTELNAQFVYRNMLTSSHFKNAVDSIRDRLVVVVFFQTTYDSYFLKTNVQGTFCSQDTRTIRGVLSKCFPNDVYTGFVHFPDEADVEDDLQFLKNQDTHYLQMN